MTYPYNQDNEPGFVFLEDNPISPDAEAIKSFFRAAEPPDVVLECRGVPGQNQELGLYNLLRRAADSFKVIQRLVQKHKLIHSYPQVFPDVFGTNELGFALFEILQALPSDLEIQKVKIDL